MSFVKPTHFEDFTFILCSSWANNIRRAMLGIAEFPAYAPPSYDDFHAVNPTAISAARGNAAIDAEFARRQQHRDDMQRRDDARLAQQQHERENDRLHIPVAALKMILEHDTNVARIHTEQIQATTRASSNAQRGWYNRRMKRGGGGHEYGQRSHGNRPRQNQFYRPRRSNQQRPPTPAPHVDVPMREATPANAQPIMQAIFGNPQALFGASTGASGSATPIDNFNYDYDYDMEEVLGEELQGSTLVGTGPVASDTGSVTDAVAGLGLGPETLTTTDDMVVV
ncbi:hypothetical protein EXIGLDRAFT_695374 [Exidia glandulosa HHB12029]|uniref:Uncharacterized protein n=1 Tax=Exidia glandulosa HHB12029 TaxID=1314781 RepID=A0A165FY67_EXIGL|nr:hypothetical protein EXIGLDRAFT_695374 [Exidia glandulosa HHB12029]